jgi:hypothetical protein
MHSHTLSSGSSTLCGGDVGETTAVCSEVSDGDDPDRLCLNDGAFLFSSCYDQYVESMNCRGPYKLLEPSRRMNDRRGLAIIGSSAFYVCVDLR